LARWRPGGRFTAKREAGGSIPAMWHQYAFVSDTLDILHFGYASASDREERYRRYVNGSGHSSSHIRSILQPPKLTSWTGTPLEDLGVRI
jgi:hypothetical protein